MAVSSEPFAKQVKRIGGSEINNSPPPIYSGRFVKRLLAFNCLLPSAYCLLLFHPRARAGAAGGEGELAVGVAREREEVRVLVE